MSRSAEERAARLAELRLKALRRIVGARFGREIDQTAAIKILSRASIADVIGALDARLNGLPSPIATDVDSAMPARTDDVLRPLPPARRERAKGGLAAVPEAIPEQVSAANPHPRVPKEGEGRPRQIQLESMTVFTPPPRRRRRWGGVALVFAAVLATVVYLWDIVYSILP
jgi:hypothetical protein